MSKNLKNHHEGVLGAILKPRGQYGGRGSAKKPYQQVRLTNKSDEGGGQESPNF